jgi:predicted RNA-binding protein with PIN domain
MKIDEHEIPKSIVLSWCAALARLPDAIARSLASEQELGAGFRANKMPPDVARARLRSALEGYTDLPETIRLALRQISPASALVVPLSDELVMEQSTLLTRSLGFAETVAALLLDGRASLRRHALEMLDDWDGSEPDEAAQREARTGLMTDLQSLAQALQALQPPGGSGSPSGPKSGLTATTGTTYLTARTPRPQAERQLVTALRDKRREAGALARELGASRQEADRLRAELERLRPALEQTQQRANHAEGELAELHGDFEALVQQRVQALLDSRLLPWLAPAEALAQAAEDPRGQHLLGQAERLLQEQATIDRRYGLHRSLQAELDDCRQMLARLAEAQAESLRPLPRLVTLQHEIRQRVLTLQQQLGEPTDNAPAAGSSLARLQQAMAQADTLEQLSSIRQALGAAEPLGMLDADERARAFAHLADLTSRLYARQGICRIAAQDREGLRSLPLHAMQSTLALGQRATLVVDGHNVLFTLPALFRPFFENGNPGGRARDALEQRLAALAKRHPRLDIQLWFDGGIVSERTVLDNMRVRFSGGSGSNRADRQILAFLHHLGTASPDLVRAVVTADQDEARAAERSGAMAMAPEELTLWLGETRT